MIRFFVFGRMEVRWVTTAKKAQEVQLVQVYILDPMTQEISQPDYQEKVKQIKEQKYMYAPAWFLVFATLLIETGCYFGHRKHWIRASY